MRLWGEVLDRKVRSLQAQPSQTSDIEQWMGSASYREWVSAELWVARG